MIYISAKLSNKCPQVGNSAFFYFAYISINSDFYAMKVAPLESHWKALSNDVYIDLGNNVLYNAIVS